MPNGSAARYPAAQYIAKASGWAVPVINTTRAAPAAAASRSSAVRMRRASPRRRISGTTYMRLTSTTSGHTCFFGVPAITRSGLCEAFSWGDLVPPPAAARDRGTVEKGDQELSVRGPELVGVVRRGVLAAIDVAVVLLQLPREPGGGGILDVDWADVEAGEHGCVSCNAQAPPVSR